MIPSITIRMVQGRPLPWGAFWREPATAGRPAKKRSRYFGTENEASAFRDATVAALKRQPEPEPETPVTPGTVAAYLADWLKLTVKPNRETKTYMSYEQLTRIHIVPTIVAGTRFGDLELADVGPMKVRALYDALYANGISYSVRKHVHSCLSSAMGSAFLDQVIDRNPCLQVGRTIRHKGEANDDPQPNPFTPEQAAAFLTYVDRHEEEWSEYFHFLHDTGVRVGEIAALKWTEVKLENKRAEIVASYSPADKADKDPKTHQVRWIDLSDLVVDQLTELQKRQRVETLKAGRKPRAYVFTNRRGSPRRQDGNMRRVFARAITKSKIGKGADARPAFAVLDVTGRVTRDRQGNVILEDHSPHDLRDTFATTHLAADYARLPWVSRQLGHENERTTVEHYFRFLPSTDTKKYANQIR